MECRKETIQKWQKRWDHRSAEKWTHELIPDIEKWIKRKHGELNFYLTQVLTGHGNFSAYLHRFRKIDSPRCIECAHETEDVRHTLFVCKRWEDNRQSLKAQIKTDITPSNMLTIMLASDDHWSSVEAFVRNIMMDKEYRTRQ